MLSPASNDLYTLVAVEFQAIIDAQYRVTSIKHTISTDKWTVDYGFSVDGQVASPSMTPSPAGITAVDGVWQTLMLTSPWTNSTQTAEIMRKNGVVYLRGAIAPARTDGVQPRCRRRHAGSADRAQAASRPRGSTGSP